MNAGKVLHCGGFGGHKHPNGAARFFAPAVPPNAQEWRLYKAYEVGMRALDKMGVPNFDETRDYVKFSAEPDFKAEILALMRTTLALKSTYCVQSFCQSVATRMASPHVLVPRSFGHQQQPVYIARPYAKERAGKEGGGYVDFKRLANHLRDLLLNDLGYPFALAELGRACAETLYRAYLPQAEPLGARELVQLALRFFGLFNYTHHQTPLGGQLMDIFDGVMKTQKNRRHYAEIRSEIRKELDRRPANS
ncbi:hypothetical protein M3Y99_01837200 [Aphelenchoides fujianensis]|nr:hypothetical protein M3Y99_01837200 [Aphelenchoides fujianensis]